MKFLLPEGRRFYRANLHAHTTLSDGALSPSELKKLYVEHGYEIVAFTDHEMLVNHSDLCDGHFLALNGYEMSFCDAGRKTPEKPTCHLSLIAKSPEVNSPISEDFWYDTEVTAEKDSADCEKSPYQNHANGEAATHENAASSRECTVEGICRVLCRASEAGFFSVLNHPFWSLQAPCDFSLLEPLCAVEVYNHLCRIGGSDDESAQALDAFLRVGGFPLPVAADDNHNHVPLSSPYCDSFGGWMMISAPTLTYEAVIEALEAGDCYASTGPRFSSLYTEDGYLCFDCSPVHEVRVVSDLRPVGARLIAKAGEELTYGKLPLPQGCRYLRVELTDAYGQKAWSRAYTDKEI